MRLRALILLALVALVAPAAAQGEGARPRCLGLGLRLQRDLSAGANLAVSPVSLQQAFAMVADGACGVTRRQILAGMYLRDTRAAPRWDAG